MANQSTAKAIPPRKQKHQPKPKHKASTAKDKPKKQSSKPAEMSKRRKRTPTNTSENEEDKSKSDHPEPKRKRFQKRRRHVDEMVDSDIEMIDDKPPTREDSEELEVDDIPVPQEEVDDILAEQQEVSTTNRLLVSSRTHKIQDSDDGLNNHHRGVELETVPVRKDSTVDLLQIMSDRTTVKFKLAGDRIEKETGRWCNICK